MQVLLIDDDGMLVRALTRQAARAAELQFAATQDPSEGLARARREPFDAVVVDELMPGLRGTEIVAILREEKPDLPLVLITGASDMKIAQRAFEVGVDHLLVKPFTLDELLAVVRSVVDKKYREQQRRLLEARVRTVLDMPPPPTPFSRGIPADWTEAKLTGAEVDVASRLVAGACIKDIAVVRGVQVTTVSSQRGRVYRKLKVSGQKELMKKYGPGR